VKRFIFLTLSCVIGCAHQQPYFEKVIDHKTSQVIVVNPIRANKTRCQLDFWQKNDQSWRRVYRYDCVLGRSGVIDGALKREGDGHTPAGIYPLTESFGYYPQELISFNYRMVTKDDLWIDDVQSPDYNTWVKAPTSAKSFEVLRRDDQQYALAVVIDYNRSPILPSKGSAIFMHVWRRYNHPTAGCVALSERHLRRMMNKLNIQENPVMMINQES
jgi:L,D-peptidoglycan transpeptidase YkuD (ErfK/YbiS/YcfS/YnhG family)